MTASFLSPCRYQILVSTPNQIFGLVGNHQPTPYLAANSLILDSSKECMDLYEKVGGF